MTHGLFDPVPLPCGAVLPNRIVKAAMEENLADPGQLPGSALYALYRRWGASGAGLLLTGNVMIDPRALTTPGGVVLERGVPLDRFRAWASVAKESGAQVWMQLNHPGRQVMADMGNPTFGPSAVALDLGKHSRRFDLPSAMDRDRIADVIRRFADAASLAEMSGFDGVQIHAAHGYLISQFLSPLTNLRDDEWGGDLAARARLLMEVVDAVRANVAPGFAVGVKLNSADFQRGGFGEEDAREVVQMLEGRGVDLVELSGGSFESPAMQGRTADQRTLDREAYFREFAVAMKRVAIMPVMMTGGVRRRATAEAVIADGVDLIGIGTALVVDPGLPRRWREEEASAAAPVVGWKDKSMAAAASTAIMRRMIQRLASDASGRGAPRPLPALIQDQFRRRSLLRRYRKWIAGRP